MEVEGGKEMCTRDVRRWLQFKCAVSVSWHASLHFQDLASLFSVLEHNIKVCGAI